MSILDTVAQSPKGRLLFVPVDVPDYPGHAFRAAVRGVLSYIVVEIDGRFEVSVKDQSLAGDVSHVFADTYATFPEAQAAADDFDLNVFERGVSDG